MDLQQKNKSAKSKICVNLAYQLALIKEIVTNKLHFFNTALWKPKGYVVPGGGINPVRLPIPPSRLIRNYTLLYNCNGAIIASSPSIAKPNIHNYSHTL